MRLCVFGNDSQMNEELEKRMYYTEFETDICRMILVGGEDGIGHLHLETGKGAGTFIIHKDWIYNDDFFSDAVKQISEYLDGKRKCFDLKLTPSGTDFQKRVWDELMKIPYGEVCSYGEIAKKLGNPKASRAVGMANGKNPIPLIIPCHRVIGSSGKLTGYAFGLDLKKRLLQVEASGLDESFRLDARV